MNFCFKIIRCLRHERSLDNKISLTDRREVSFIINDEFFPLLKQHGYNYISDEDSFEFIQPKESISLLEYWNITQGIIRDHEVDQEWLTQTFDVPIVGKREIPFGFGFDQQFQLISGLTTAQTGKLELNYEGFIKMDSIVDVYMLTYTCSYSGRTNHKTEYQDGQFEQASIDGNLVEKTNPRQRQPWVDYGLEL